MGVYIKDMEMPDNCALCPMWDAGNCLAASEAIICEYDKRPQDCPLVPVPPHGRLIDADALIEDLKYDVELDAVALDSMETVGDERRKIQDDKDFKQNCIFWIEDAPAVLEAEEGE